MPREIDEAWIEEAVRRYRRIESLQAEFDQAVDTVEVTVRSPDGLVEVVVTANGRITDVRFLGPLHHRHPREIAASVRAAVTAAADAALWAREKLHNETFAAYRPLAGA
ncbi:YbaB/EbfC family nucleoid-associated protein [Micromonospora sp. KC213]|uniref:YbaB/EbfC family nucleoid-associated protein n=1 Tax=Micromonospora sp. KC213 TaxID=2530378 RepID=UPI0010495C2F|nr:YbaB/EbfC family nucleoid-associated protein [Micromonospora sp. KC213]TDC34113.1 YbaB/EbfC family DNA-binding protein [Micromonospora sp. KC213]